MITDLIVVASTVLALVFVAAWAASPRLRAWIERPKYRFQDSLRDYDRREIRDQRSGTDRGSGNRNQRVGIEKARGQQVR